MIALIQFNIVMLAAAMSIGVVTGLWMFVRRTEPPQQAEDGDQP